MILPLNARSRMDDLLKYILQEYLHDGNIAFPFGCQVVKLLSFYDTRLIVNLMVPGMYCWFNSKMNEKNVINAYLRETHASYGVIPLLKGLSF